MSVPNEIIYSKNYLIIIKIIIMYFSLIKQIFQKTNHNNSNNLLGRVNLCY